jgi:hypothetical protein
MQSNQPILDDNLLEMAIIRDFDIRIEIKHVVVRNIPTSRTTNATVFVTSKGLLYAYINGQASLQLGDVARQVKRMGLTASSYVPPKRDKEYFERVARAKYNSVFPGRKLVKDDDLRFYRQLVHYQPALVLISEIPEGVIKQFDSNATTQWRPAAKFSYRRANVV